MDVGAWLRRVGSAESVSVLNCQSRLTRLPLAQRRPTLYTRARMRPRLLAFALVAIVVLVGCKLGRAYFLRDTEGGRYRVNCAASDCERVLDSPLRAQPARACGSGSRAGFVLAGRRVLVACASCVDDHGPTWIDEEQCRPLRCEHDADCPPRHAGVPTRCVNGLCQAPSQPELDRAAVAGLCMAGAGPVDGRVVAREFRMSMARAACDAAGRCTPPPTCRQP